MRFERRTGLGLTLIVALMLPLVGSSAESNDQSVFLTGSLQAASADRFGVPVTRNWNLQLKWLIEEGTRVGQGDAIARFDSAGVEDQLLTSEESLEDQLQQRAMAVSDGRLRRLELELEYKRARIELKKSELDAAVPDSVMKGVDFQERQMALARATKRLDDAQLALDTQIESQASIMTGHDVDVDKLRGSIKRAKKELDSLVLRAGADGIVVHEEHPWFGRKVREGDQLQATFPVASIPDLSTLEVEAWAAEIDLVRLTEGQPVRLMLDAFPQRELHGKISEIAQGGEERQQWGRAPYFRVRIQVDDLDPSTMKPGMSVLCMVLAPRAKES